MRTSHFKMLLILTTIISLPAFTQPTRNMGAGSTSPTSRQEISIPDTGKYQKRESPDSIRHKYQSRKQQTDQHINEIKNTVQNTESDNHTKRPPTAYNSPVFKKNINPSKLQSSLDGTNGGDIINETCPAGYNFITPVVIDNNTVTTHPHPIINSKSPAGRKQHSKHRHYLFGHIDDWNNKYLDMKKKLSDLTGITYSLDVSFLGQRGAPNGHITPWQSQYYGTATWNMFQSDKWGSGTAEIAYELVRYWNGNASILGNNIGVVSGVNDYTTKSDYFYQLSYTHQFAGDMKWLSVTLGQFPLSNFDGTTYDSNQQLTFLNEALSQNISSTYAIAGLGAYVTVSPNSFWSVSGGFQDATNIDGNRISTSHLDDSKYTTFVSGTINPKNKLGQSTISVLYYHQPSVPEQIGKTNGWSINAQQNIGKKTAVFTRINGTTKGLNGIKQSYVFGGVYNNPINRNALDQIGLAVAVNKPDKGVNGSGTRSVENVIEGYWAWGIGSFMTITPDIQFYINPALNRKSNTATVASLRATMMF